MRKLRHQTSINAIDVEKEIQTGFLFKLYLHTNRPKDKVGGKGNSDRLSVQTLTGATSQNPLKSTEEKLRILGILYEPHKVSHKDGIFSKKSLS